MKLYCKKNVIEYENLYEQGHNQSHPNFNLVRIQKFFDKKSKNFSRIIKKINEF